MTISFPLSMVLLLSITSHLWGECICIIRKHVMAVVNDLISSGCSPPSYARCKLAQLQHSFPQAPRPLSNQTTLLYLQRSPAHLLMRPERGPPDLGCSSILIPTLPGFLALAVPQALCEAVRGNRRCGQCSPIPWRLLFHYDHESPGSRTQNLRCSCVFHALKFHIFAVPHESLGRVIDKQELFKGEQLK